MTSKNSTATTTTLPPRPSNQPIVAAVLRALDALADGDVLLAEASLTAALDGDSTYVVRARCRFCPAEYEWAGLRDRHEVLFHVENLDPDHVLHLQVLDHRPDDDVLGGRRAA